MKRRPDSFFRLAEPYDEFKKETDFWSLVGGRDEGRIEDFLYRPDSITSPQPPKKWLVRNKTFHNVSFSHTHLSHLEFSDCKFEKCLFIGTTITDCRFSSCAFVDCNLYRSQIERCYIDPRSFDACLDSAKHPNIGVALYQDLLHNSRQQAQPDFTLEAQYQFARWQRYLAWDEIWRSEHSCFQKCLKCLSVFPAWVFEKAAGSGMRLGNLAVTSGVALVLLTFFNYYFRTSFGLELQGQPVDSVVEAFYFSTIVVTSLGFGDITPTTGVGQAMVAIEAILGFVAFATLVSMIFRRITS